MLHHHTVWRRFQFCEYGWRVETETNSSVIPHHVEKSLNDGDTMVHKGLLAWIPLLPTCNRYRLRYLFLLLETVFTLYLWAMISQKDYYMPTICPWPRESLPYHGCCTDLSINEGLPLNEFPADLTAEKSTTSTRSEERPKRRRYLCSKCIGYGENALER